MNPNVARHRSREVAQALSRQIRKGEVPVGSFLPPARALASKFGVSLNTVQIALRELETLSLVQSIPRRGTVVTKTSAATSSARRPRHIGVVVPMANENQPRDLWGMRILHAAEELLFDAGTSMVFLPYVPQSSADEGGGGGGGGAMVERIDRLGDFLGGVICFANPGVHALLAELDARHIPWVTINRPEPGMSHNFVAADNLAAGRRVGRCFGKLGYERVAILTDDVAFDSASLEKVTGFFQGRLEVGASTHGVEVVTCADWRADWREQDGYDAARAMIDRGDVPQAIFAAGDLLAIGAIRALTEEGLRVPEDVGLVGATGLSTGDESTPRLTVVAQSMEQMGRHAARMLLEMIDGGIRRMIGRKIAGRFVLRESLAVPDAVREELESQQPAEEEFTLESPVIENEGNGYHEPS